MRFSDHLFASALLLVACFFSGHSFEDSRTPAYARRGDEVEALFAEYSSRLARHHERLSAAVSAWVPELSADLEKSDPVTAGYQVLPTIAARESGLKKRRLGAVAYSWPWTAHLIERELQALEWSESQVGILSLQGRAANKPLLERLLQNYRGRRLQHQNLAAHIAYNRFWQGVIASNRAAYDRETALQRIVLARERIDAQLQRVRAIFAKPNESFRVRAPAGFQEIERHLVARRALLAQRIDEAMRDFHAPAFVRIERSPHGWIFRVPLFTDVEDRDFVERFRQIIESKWRLLDGKTDYRVLLEITPLPPAALYAEAVPKAGEPLELSRHLARFPAGAGILTTGGITTHARDRAIVLGPHPLTPGTIAHEFGHILGFRDRYVRGYRNLGRNGFQVMEIIADPADIMAATPHGVVQPGHFSRLVQFYSRKPPELQQLRSLQQRNTITQS